MNTFEEINLRDLLDILCQTFFHTCRPGTGQTEDTIQYNHLRQSLLKIYTTAPALLIRLQLSLVYMIRNAYANTEWFFG